MVSYLPSTTLTHTLLPTYLPAYLPTLSTKPNAPPWKRQEFLESSYPAYTVTTTTTSPTKEAIASASAGDEKALDREAREGHLVEPSTTTSSKLSTKNTIAKMILDQTVGAAGNTFLFSVFIHSIQAAMAGSSGGGGGGGAAIDYSRVDWIHVLARSRAEFFALVVAGWRLWPLVSLVNFTLIKTVEGRNLVGGLAGVVWGGYMSLVAAAGS